VEATLAAAGADLTLVPAAEPRRTRGGHDVHMLGYYKPDDRAFRRISRLCVTLASQSDHHGRCLDDAG
jgi:hypothetical protein